MSYDINGANQADMPMTTDNYKRAVFRAAPSRFSVEFLTPAKQGGAHSHGMRICPLSLGDRASISSRSSSSDYDVWRRWEDCLWLQDTLESEYKRAAREKRQRLLQGKGVKSFNGMYKQDMASSWESLPPGPDPNSVARDIHQHIPFLTKKGTLFRASLATVEQRQREFEGLIEALFRDDMPALIKEIRSSRIVTDFFGYWRRDYDLDERNRKAGKPRSSVTGSVFSMYFSTSNPDKACADTSSPAKKSPRKSKEKERPHSAVASETTEEPDQSSRRSSTESADASTSVAPRRRALSNSSDSSSSQSDISSGSSAVSSTPAIADEAPFVFGHNPIQASDTAFSVCPLLEPLREEQEDLEKWRREDFKAAYLRRPKTSAGDRPSNRQCSIFISPPNVPDFLGSAGNSPTDETAFADSSIRESWQTTSSNATLLEGLGLTTEPSYRASMASIATFMTTDSANAVIPLTPTTPRPNVAQPFVKARPRISEPVSLSDFEMWSEIDEEDSSTANLDEFPRPTSFISDGADSRPETPLGLFNNDSMPEATDVPEPASPTASTFSETLSICTTTTDLSTSTATTHTSTSTATTHTSVSTAATDITTASSTSSSYSSILSIKAAHNNSIIMLRVPREITLADLRQRLYNKFVGQEGIPLSQSFVVACMLPKSSTAQRTRSSSVSCAANEAHMELIKSQAEWDLVTTFIDGSKLTLRILDGP